MTLVGLMVLVTGLVSLIGGLVLHWPALSVLGISLLAGVAIALVQVLRPYRLLIERQVQPARVPKGTPAIVLLRFDNVGRSLIPQMLAYQPFGVDWVRLVVPRLHRGERGMRTYRLPTTRRGIYDLEPVEVLRSDPFELFRVTMRYGDPQRIWVCPRVVTLRELAAGQTRHIEGPSSDSAPSGNVTFHRLRDYVAGDDLRLVHWRSSARTGTLVVRHNVDTSQPYSVVVLDDNSERYSPESFEEAVDVAASAVMSLAADKAPVELRTADGTTIGGPRLYDPTPLIDCLTGVQLSDGVNLRTALTALRRARGGTSLVVVTGAIDPGVLQLLASLRRRFTRLVLVSINPENPEPLYFQGIRIIVARDLEEVCAAWNMPAR